MEKKKGPLKLIETAKVPAWNETREESHQGRLKFLVMHPELQQIEPGLLGTHAGLLKCANHLAKSLMRDKPSAVLLSVVVASNGKYSFDLRFGDGRRVDLLDKDNGFNLLVSTIADDVRRVAENAKRDEPLPLCSLNISPARQAILEGLAEVQAFGGVVLLRCELSERESLLALPTKDELKVVEVPSVNATTVIGKITGVGVGNRLEINRGEWLTQNEWSTEKACSLMNIGMNINAKKILDNGVMKLIEITLCGAKTELDLDNKRSA
jgi:hypothetical protein